MFVKKHLLLAGIFSVLIMVLFLNGGCAHGSRARKGRKSIRLVYASAKKIPQWITQIPSEKEYYYFVGASSDVPSLSEGKKEAVNDALKQIVETIGVKVTTETTTEEKYYAEQFKVNLSNKLLQKGEARLQGAELKSIYYEKYQKNDGSIFFRVWVLIKYSKKEIQKEQRRLQAILELRYGEVKKYENDALKFEKDHNYFQAIQYYIQAALSAVKIEDGDVFFDRDINRATVLVSRIKIKKFGDNQIGYVGKPLPRPFVLYVYVTEGNKEYPQKLVPVKFLYRIPRERLTGYKYLVYKKSTDENGKAYLKINKVYEVSDQNVVEAKIDFGQFLEQLSLVPRKYRGKANQFRILANSKKIDFVFKSDTKAKDIKTAIYIIQVDMDGSLIPKPIVAPEIYNVLYGRHFNVKLLDIPPSKLYKKENRYILDKLDKESGKSVKRILFGYAKITSYEMLSGFYVVQANVNVNLYDKGTGNIIYNWQFTRSGTGSTKDEAQLSVFTEIGQSLGEIASRSMP